jgi:outer membrane protein OmpA-like peptidoglycan-associated protein
VKRLFLLSAVCLWIGGCCGLVVKSDSTGNVPLTKSTAKASDTVAKAAVKVEKAASIADSQVDELSKIADTKKEGKDVVVNLKGDLLFATRSDKLTDAAKAKIAAIAAVLAKDKKSAIKVTGHTDSRGVEANNLKLSEGRAQAVKAELVANGVAADKVSTTGKGSTVPVASNDTAAGRAANRRAEIRIVH